MQQLVGGMGFSSISSGIFSCSVVGHAIVTNTAGISVTLWVYLLIVATHLQRAVATTTATTTSLSCLSY